MAFSLSKIFKSKPITNASELLNQIDYKEGTKYAENETAKVYLDIEELGGFPYLKTMLFGVDDINVKRVGCSITFIFKDEELTLNSDNTTIESNHINKSGLFYTPVDFELDESEAKKIQSKKVTDLKFTFKNKIVLLKTV